MEIQSTINMEKFIEVDSLDHFGEHCDEQVGYLSASLNKNGNQCVINIQLFDDEKIKENSIEVEKQVLDFFNHLSACMKDSKLECVGKMLPKDKSIENKIRMMNL